MSDATPASTEPRIRAAVITCAALVLVFTVLSATAVATKSATVDEPLHALGAYLHVVHDDFRINPEDPPLWNYWVMLPHGRDALRIDRQDRDWHGALHDTGFQTPSSVITLYNTPGNDGVAFIERARWMMLPIGAALVVLTAAWAWRLAGPAAGVVAATLIGLDPNFVAHAPLVKNDVAITLLLLAVTMAAWSVGRRIAWWNVALLAALCGAAAATKFSGVLAAPMLTVTLLARALLPAPWLAASRQVRSRAAKLCIALSICVACAVVGIAIIWAAYGFRFVPTAESDRRLNLQSQVDQAKRHAFVVRYGRYPDDATLARLPAPPVVAAAQWLERHRLLPHAYVYGFVYTYQQSLVRGAYLMGAYSDTGWWYYFPLAMLFKTPLATLAALTLALVLALVRLARTVKSRATAHGSAVGLAGDRWSALCLAVPLLVYGASALMSNLNLGLRHVFPLYPFLFILTGIAAARLQAARPRLVRPVAIVLTLGLFFETLSAFPHYIPFFNTIFKPHRLYLLSDSNLDWGQDLPLLAEWQRQHPLERLYLAYFGAVPPDDVYGIDYTKIPGGYFMREQIEWPEQPGAVIAISATLLQGTHLPPSLRAYYRPLRQAAPREVLGGSIYLFDVPSPPLPRPTREMVERELQREREQHGR